MLEYISNETNKTYTENGAITYESTGSDCLDLFSLIGALRYSEEDEIIKRFLRAYLEDKIVATKLLFYARDIRGGLGERKVFRVIIRWLASNEKETVIKNLDQIAEFGRYDDLLVLIGTPCEKEALSYIKKCFEKDMQALKQGETVSLLGKWLPSVNASNSNTVITAKKVAKFIGLSYENYRKAVVALRKEIKIIENNLREKVYDFDYSKQPSKAMYKYRAAFMRNDAKRYSAYIEDVINGKKKLNAETLSPYELVESILKRTRNAGELLADEKNVINATWNSLPDYSTEDNAIAVIDTSGSMYYNANPCPASVALSLGIYFAEHNKGSFGNCFIEFSERPQLIRLKGSTFVDKLGYVLTFNEVANTDIDAVFNLILNVAIENKVPQNELPKRIIIISDMEFDTCADNADATNFENAKKKYAAHGYKLPQVVFWNVDSRHGNQPVKMNEQGVTLVSGCTPKLFSMVAEDTIDPYAFMMNVVNSERYLTVCA